MKDFIFTIVHDEIYVLETPRRALKKYGEKLHLVHHGKGHNYYFTFSKAQDLLWLNILELDLALIEDQHEFLKGLSAIWPYFAEGSVSEQVYPLSAITFYGGSFNPWHDGHSTCVKRVFKHGPILILPDSNPKKEQKELEFPLKKYIGLSKRIKKELNIGAKWVYPGFVNVPNGNPTHTWVNQVLSKYPKLEINLAMGFDNAKAINKWIQHVDLIKKIDGLYILSRNETDQQRDDFVSLVKGINSDVKIEFLGHHPYENVSSTKIRSK